MSPRADAAPRPDRGTVDTALSTARGATAGGRVYDAVSRGAEQWMTHVKRPEARP